MRKAVVVFLCALSFTACGGDDDGGDKREIEDGKLGEDEKDEPGNDGGVAAGKLSDDELSEEVVAKFVECGLQEESASRNSDDDEGIDDDFDRCIARCTLASTCNNLKQSVCSEPSGVFGSCLDGCDPAPDDGFACKDGTKIPHLFLCDGSEECAGGEDEQNCESACEDGSAPASTVTVCDGKKDCKDGSDEAGCPICS